jgi:uncharacterized protein (DUF1800 family)
MQTETEFMVEDVAAPTTTPAAPPLNPSEPSAPPTNLAPAALSLLAAAVLAACGGGGGSNSAGSAAAGFNNYPKAQTDEEAARFILQSQLAATDAEISAVRSTTFAEYLQQQYAKPIGEKGWDWLEARGYGVSDKYRYFFSNYPADFMIWKQIFTSQDSMRKRAALALSEFFVVSLALAEFTWRSHAFASWWDMLVKNAFGNFRQLLEDVTLHPAMGEFLNTRGNQKENANGRVPDENYAREVMQLFTIGLFQLNPDGTEKTGANGKKLESYTQDDVTNLARVFTGYDFDVRPSEEGVISVINDNGGVEDYKLDTRDFAARPMSFDAKKHSTLAATFLGTTVAAGAAGPAALTTALDTLFNHPNVGAFFGKQMIQRLVTSNPSPAYVARVAATFNNNGAGVRGDLKAVWTAILLDDEARSPATLTDASFGKLREPMLRFIQWGRSFGLNSKENSWKMFETSDAAEQLGQSPLRAPSVFNFFRPGFVPPNTALAAKQSPAPEFQLVNESTVGGYLNYMQEKIRYGIYTGDPKVPFIAGNQTYVPDVTASYTKELGLVTDATALVRRLNLILCAGQLSADTQATMVAALNATTLAADANQDQKLNRVGAAVLMVMASPEYLVQK